MTAPRWTAPLACALALAAAGAASAHTEIERTLPADGAVLTAPPRRVVVVYAQPVAAPGDSSVKVAGRDVMSGPARLAAGDARRLVLPLGAGAGPGAYAARWVVTAADGDEVSGEAGFTVRVRPLVADLRALAVALDRAAARLTAALPAREV